MIRYREFAISAASLAAMSLSSGCIDVGNVRGDWSGTALITSYGDTYSLPFSFTGTTTSYGFFGGTITEDFTEFTRSITMSVDKDDVATLTSNLSKVYTYIYDSGYDTYTYDVTRSYARSYRGPATKTGSRQFDIVMDQTKNEYTLTINGDDYSPQAADSPTTTSKVLQCGTDGTELHCFDGGNNLMIFTQD